METRAAMDAGAAVPAERRAAETPASLDQPSERMIGKVVSCNGSRATIASSARDLSGTNTDFWSIGKLISISTPVSRIVGLVYDMHTTADRWHDDVPNTIRVNIELVGEIVDGPGKVPEFRRGIAVYPPLGSVAHRIRARDLKAVHDLGERGGIEIGRVAQDTSILATVNADDMLKRHFAVVGTTGVGKSTAVSLLLRRLVEAKKNLRILVLDPHNEYTRSFGDISITIDSASLELPFWLFRFDEMCEVVFRGRNVIEERDILRDLIPLAKARHRQEAQASGMASGLLKKPGENSSVSADTPLPYRITDLVKLIDENIGMLEPRYARYDLKSLRSRIESLSQDPAFRFMFGKVANEESLERIVGRLFRIPSEDRRITVLQMNGIPSDVVNAVASVLARLSFDIAVWSGGACEVLLLCEEAHRYVPVDKSLGFVPTRQAIAKIAKEGRKYGCYLGVVTQRPGELDPTILSQCSTIFAMRLANDQDQEIIRSAIADSSASTISFLSSLAKREAIAFGEGVATSMRMVFDAQDPNLLPRAATDLTAINGDGEIDLRGIVNRMRSQGIGEQMIADYEPPPIPQAPSITMPDVASFQTPQPSLAQQHFGSAPQPYVSPSQPQPFGASPTLRKQPAQTLAPEPLDVQKGAWPTFTSRTSSPPTRFR
jgi:uncharacterized protein